MVNEFDQAAEKLAGERRKAADDEAKRQAEIIAQVQAQQDEAAKAKERAQARWPEIWALLGRAVESYNARSGDTRVTLQLAEEMEPRSWLKPYRLSISSPSRHLAIVFTIGQQDKVGYRILETKHHSGSSVLPHGLPQQGGVEDIPAFVTRMVATVAAAR